MKLQYGDPEFCVDSRDGDFVALASLLTKKQYVVQDIPAEYMYRHTR